MWYAPNVFVFQPQTDKNGCRSHTNMLNSRRRRPQDKTFLLNTLFHVVTPRRNASMFGETDESWTTIWAAYRVTQKDSLHNSIVARSPIMNCLLLWLALRRHSERSSFFLCVSLNGWMRNRSSVVPLHYTSHRRIHFIFIYIFRL